MHVCTLMHVCSMRPHTVMSAGKHTKGVRQQRGAVEHTHNPSHLGGGGRRTTRLTTEDEMAVVVMHTCNFRYSGG